MSVDQIIISGNVTRKPTLRYSPKGYPVTELTVASNYRRRDPNSREWHDVARTYYTVTCWRHLAEHVSQSLDKGHPVVVVGRIYVEEWTDRDGVLRKTPKIDPVTVGYDLQFSAVLAPARSSSFHDREQGGPRRTADAWEESSGGEPEEMDDPFDATTDSPTEGPTDSVADDGRLRAVAAVPASEG